ncbi:MAG: hypothetical protein M1837_007503 [Sclerophora amabilis]|nr:MAG: hypothetical protein M1837_007503 [Sclerophora amabilis]
MFISKSWKTPRVLLGFFVLEFLNTIAILALFGIASPDLYRTNLWGDGAMNGFNSNPNQILYAYANYEPIPKTPMVWSQFITNFNVIIAVLSMFLLLVKVVLNVMHLFYPVLSLAVHMILTALYAVSIYGQAGPDNSDPEHPSSSPWYLTKSCDVAFEQSNVHYCQMAKGSFAVTVIMLSIFVVHLGLAIYSLVPNAEMKRARESSKESDIAMTKASPYSEFAQDRPWENHGTHAPIAQTPTTPHGAFNTLSNPLPLRNQNDN